MSEVIYYGLMFSLFCLGLGFTLLVRHKHYVIQTYSFLGQLCFFCIFAFISGGCFSSVDPPIGRLLVPCISYLLGICMGLIGILVYCHVKHQKFYCTLSCWIMTIFCTLTIVDAIDSHVIFCQTPTRKYPLISSNVYISKTKNETYIYLVKDDITYQKQVPKDVEPQLLHQISRMTIVSDAKEIFLYRFDLLGVLDISTWQRLYIIRDYCREEVIKISRKIFTDESIPLKEI